MILCKKINKILTLILSALLLFLCYVPESTVRINTYFEISFEYRTFGDYMDEFGWIVIGAVVVLCVLAFTRFYAVGAIPATVALAIILWQKSEIKTITNIYISEDLYIILIILTAALLLLNTVWSAILFYLEKRGPIIRPCEGPAGELQRYKSLLDQGVITQEEFEAKKKQILGL